MQHKRNSLVPIGEVLSGLGGRGSWGSGPSGSGRRFTGVNSGSGSNW